MNRKCVLVLTVFVLSSACFCQELPDIKDTLETDRQQYAVIADTIAAAKDSAAAAAHSAWLEESNNPQSAHIISFESIPEPQRNVVGQYYEQFAGYLQTCDGMNLQNTVKKANEEFPYFLRVNFKFFDFKLDLGHNSGTVLSQMLDWSLSCRLTSEDILTVYALNKPFHDNPSQLEILSKAAKVDSFKAAAKFFAERPVCKLSCKKSFLKEALLSSFNNLETIKMLLAKVGTPSVDFIVLLIRKPTLCDKDVPVLRML
ncbi:MAG: hypothetical protein LBG16_02460, partial [Elusimicrobiota bacterium]|nr:hypothetical protein [Elusimicrobiota bacterium]